MPCWLTINIRVADKQAALDAMKRMGIDPRNLRQRGSEWEVINVDKNQEKEFRRQYARSFAVQSAKKKFFAFTKEETLKDGSIKLTFEN